MAAAKPPQAKGKTAPPGAAESGGGLARVILLTGVEAARKSAEAERLLREAVDADWADFDAETLDGNTATVDRILAAAGTIPMGVGRRAVLVRDTQQMEPDEQRRLAEGLGRVPPSGLVLLHTGTPVTEDGKVKRASVVTAELTNAVKRVGGRVIDFALPRADDLPPWLAGAAKRLGKTLAPDALALLAQLPGEDLLRAGSELAKAAAYAGDAPRITAADVEATLSRGPDDVIFKLCDAVGARRSAEALGHLSQLFRGGQRPDAVAPRALVLLARHVRLLAQFKYLAGKGLAGRKAALPEDVARLLPAEGAVATLANPRSAWMADRYAAQARNFTGAELTGRLELLLAADLSLKGIEGGGEPPQLILQRLVVALC